MKHVLVFGTFDILHPGHLYFLREAKKYGQRLTVVVTPSAVVKRLKGAAPLFGEAHRVAAVKLMSFVDRVVLGDRTLSSFTVLTKYKPDVICFGYDQKNLAQYVQSYYKKIFVSERSRGPTFVHLKPYNPRQHKSSRLKKLLSGEEVCMRCRI